MKRMVAELKTAPNPNNTPSVVLTDFLEPKNVEENHIKTIFSKIFFDGEEWQFYFICLFELGCETPQLRNLA